jgi:hypothetical protein
LGKELTMNEPSDKVRVEREKIPFSLRQLGGTTRLPPKGLDGPDGLWIGYWHIASECLSDARLLDKSSNHIDYAGQYILTCHALELSLKAFLAKAGLSEDKLRNPPYRHDLNYLYADSLKRELDLSHISPHVKELIALFNEHHYKNENEKIDFAFRYYAGLRELPACSNLFQIIDGILSVCRP